jgi:tetratricopeptide (TPR) repeat protein
MKWLSRLLGGKEPLARENPAPKPPQPAGPAVAEANKKKLTFREGTPEFDLFIARGTLELGEDLPHGAQHLAQLLEVDPARGDWRALVDQYVHAAEPDIDALVPDTEPRYAATEALRAYLWQMQGRTADAVARLVDVCKAQGNARYLHAWALEWLEPEGAIEALPEHTCLAVLGTVLTHSEEVHISSARTLGYMRRWAGLAERAPLLREQTGLPIMLRAGLLRKAGRVDEALAVAGPIEHAQEFSRAAAIGLALRRKGRLEASAQAFAKGIELEPQNASGHLEAGNSCLEDGRWQQALQYYQAALQIEPGHAWAEPSASYCRWKLDQDESWMLRLADASMAGNARAHELIFRAHGHLNESGDASANILRQVRTSWMKEPPKPAAHEGDMALTVSTMEAPSNRLAFALEMAAFQQNGRLKVTVTAMPSIDPRRPVEEVTYLLWRFDGTDPYPALPPPSAEVSARIAALAAEPYDPQVNWARASHVAVKMGAGKVTELLAVMVHPPALPPGAHALAWLPRVQLAAAQVLGQIDEGWEQSARRRALLSLLYGPWDWTTCAAIRTLAWIAREEPAHATDVHQAFERLAAHAPDEGHWDWPGVLYKEWQTLPFLFDNERESLRAKEAALTKDPTHD